MKSRSLPLYAFTSLVLFSFSAQGDEPGETKDAKVPPPRMEKEIRKIDPIVGTTDQRILERMLLDETTIEFFAQRPPMKSAKIVSDDFDVDYELVIGKLKYVGRSDVEIKSMLKDQGISEKNANCMVNAIKCETRLTDAERRSMVAIVASPLFQNDPILKIDRDVVKAKLKLAGLNEKEIISEFEKAGMPPETAKCFIESCPNASNFTPKELAALGAAVKIKDRKNKLDAKNVLKAEGKTIIEDGGDDIPGLLGLKMKTQEYIKKYDFLNDVKKLKKFQKDAEYYREWLKAKSANDPQLYLSPIEEIRKESGVEFQKSEKQSGENTKAPKKEGESIYLNGNDGKAHPH